MLELTALVYLTRRDLLGIFQWRIEASEVRSAASEARCRDVFHIFLGFQKSSWNEDGPNCT